ncbi:hypothetical protein D3C87_2093800 [compost metagenome]
MVGAGRDAVVHRQLLERAAGEPVDTGIPDMEDVCGARFQHQYAQGADIATIDIVGLAGAGLGVQPGIGGRDDAVG